MRIMYVEDNGANLALIERVARIGGHEVVTYTDGESALKNFDTAKPDLILMDIQLSGAMSGLDVVRKLRAAGHEMPIVAVTAYAMLGDRDRCIEAGCTDYMPKPLPVPELVSLFERHSKSKVADKVTPTIKPKVEANGTKPDVESEQV